MPYIARNNGLSHQWYAALPGDATGLTPAAWVPKTPEEITHEDPGPLKLVVYRLLPDEVNMGVHEPTDAEKRVAFSGYSKARADLDARSAAFVQVARDEEAVREQAVAAVLAEAKP